AAFRSPSPFSHSRVSRRLDGRSITLNFSLRTAFCMARGSWDMMARTIRVPADRCQREPDRSLRSQINLFWSMVPKSVQRFSEKHALGLDPRDHAQTKSLLDLRA